MARKRREWNPRMFDHVITRGNNRQNIFRNESDFAEFFRVLQNVHQKHPFTIIAYCIMTNHYHLLIRSPEVPLGKIMSRVNKRYSNYYQKKYEYSGFLYDSRYFAKMVTDPRGLLAVSRYIHRNPIETKVPMTVQMERYPYSSYPLYKSGAASPYPFLELDLLPSLLPADEDYCRYCEEEEGEEELEE